MAKINIAFGMTGDWLHYTLVTICSILCNANKDDEYCFYIMCDWNGMTVSDYFDYFDTLDIIKPAEYKFLKMEEKWFEGAIHDHLGISSSYRLKLPSLVKDNKILYLDSDVICTQDISELYSKDVSGYSLAAVEDKQSLVMSKRVGLNTEKGEIFINGGVQLMNLDYFREHDLETIIFDKLRKNDNYTDQDVINDVCRSSILQLPLKYNIMIIKGEDTYITRKAEYEEAKNNPFIIHYTHKPWEYQVPLWKVWDKYFEILQETKSTRQYNP